MYGKDMGKGLFEVQIYEEMGLLSFHTMHTALGHALADTIASSSSLYTDSHLIPQKRKG